MIQVQGPDTQTTCGDPSRRLQVGTEYVVGIGGPCSPIIPWSELSNYSAEEMELIRGGMSCGTDRPDRITTSDGSPPTATTTADHSPTTTRTDHTTTSDSSPLTDGTGRTITSDRRPSTAGTDLPVVASSCQSVHASLTFVLLVFFNIAIKAM